MPALTPDTFAGLYCSRSAITAIRVISQDIHTIDQGDPDSRANPAFKYEKRYLGGQGFATYAGSVSNLNLGKGSVKMADEMRTRVISLLESYHKAFQEG